MLLSTLLLATLAAGPIKLAAPGFNAVDVDPKRADFFVDYFADQLAAQGGVRVTTKSEIAALIGMERQKELLGCGDTSSGCLAELSGALGVDGLVVGNVVKVGKGTAVTLKIVRANSAEPIASASGRFDDDGRLLDWMREVAPGFVERLRAAFSAGAATADRTGERRPEDPSAPTSVVSPSPPMNRFIVGPLTLGYERWLGSSWALGIHGHAQAGPRFLLWPQFTVGAWGGPYVRWRVLSAGAFELSMLGTVGYGVTQNYRGPEENLIHIGLLAAPGVELSWFGFGVAVETPIHFLKTYDSVNEGSLSVPVFLRLTYAFAF